MRTEKVIVEKYNDRWVNELIRRWSKWKKRLIAIILTLIICIWIVVDNIVNKMFFTYSSLIFIILAAVNIFNLVCDIKKQLKIQTNNFKTTYLNIFYFVDSNV